MGKGHIESRTQSLSKLRQIHIHYYTSQTTYRPLGNLCMCLGIQSLVGRVRKYPRL
jgi:hypothetical protein